MVLSADALYYIVVSLGTKFPCMEMRSNKSSHVSETDIPDTRICRGICAKKRYVLKAFDNLVSISKLGSIAPMTLASEDDRYTIHPSVF